MQSARTQGFVCQQHSQVRGPTDFPTLYCSHMINLSEIIYCKRNQANTVCPLNCGFKSCLNGSCQHARTWPLPFVAPFALLAGLLYPGKTWAVPQSILQNLPRMAAALYSGGVIWFGMHHTLEMILMENRFSMQQLPASTPCAARLTTP